MNSSYKDASELAASIKKAISNPSSSMEDASASVPLDSSPNEKEGWLYLGRSGENRLALLWATISSVAWQPSPHLLRLTTQQDGVVTLDFSALDSSQGEQIWAALVAKKIVEIAAPFEVLVVE